MKNSLKLTVTMLVMFLYACNGNVREGSIGSLAQTDEILKDDAATELSMQKDATVVEYSRFIRLFDTVSDEAMRRVGMRKMAALQLEYKNAEHIPLTAVITLFENLLNDYPQQRNDQLLYQLSREYEENGEQNAALDSLNRLVEQYEDTKYYDEAQFRRGEILFTKRQFALAEAAYKEVVSYRAYDDKSVYYEQAVYKQGWSQFKLSNYQQALNSFMHLLDLHAVEGLLKLDKMSSSERDFVEDTLRAINLSFSYQAGPVSVHDYFAGKQKRLYEYSIYASLAEFYLQKQHYADAVKTYRLFVADNEMHPRSAEFLLRVITIYEEGGFADLLIEAKKDFVQRYNIKSPFWRLYAAADYKPEFAALKKNLQQLASYYHARAQQSHSKLDYREAQRWYRVWLDSFPTDPAAAEMNFLFAEILNEDKQYESAVLQYERTAYDYKRHNKSAEAGYAALLTYGRRLAELQGAEQQPSQYRQQLRQWHRQSIDSAIRFAIEFPYHAESSKVLTQAVNDLFELGEYEKAHMIATQISGSEKDPALLGNVWVVLGHIEFAWNDFLKAEKAYAKALSYLPASDPLRDGLSRKEALAVYKQGELSNQKGDYKAAVQHFSRVKQVSSEVGLVANAEYDAATALISLRDWAKAASVLEAFRKTNRNHKLQPEVTKKLAVIYLEKGDIAQASVEFERVSKLAGAAEYQLEALWQSAELAEQSGNSARAAKVYTDFVSRYPRPFERNLEAQQRLIELYEREGNKKHAANWRLQLVKVESRGGKLRTERTAYLAAKASFALAEPAFDAYRKVKLTIPLKRSLKNKRHHMDQALTAYAQAASYKDAEILTAATYRIAEIYQDLGLAIFNSERPAKLSQEELQQYDILLEEKAYPFEEKAIEFHELNVSRFADGLSGVWIWKSLQQLKGFLPVRYDKQERNDVIVKDIF